MTDHILTSIFIYLIIGIPIMMSKFEDMSLSFEQLMLRWFCWPVVVLRYIKELWRK